MKNNFGINILDIKRGDHVRYGPVNELMMVLDVDGDDLTTMDETGHMGGTHISHVCEHAVSTVVLQTTIEELIAL